MKIVDPDQEWGWETLVGEVLDFGVFRTLQTRVVTEDMKTRAHDELFKRDKGIRFMLTFVERSCVSLGRSFTSESTRWRFKAT